MTQQELTLTEDQELAKKNILEWLMASNKEDDIFYGRESMSRYLPGITPVPSNYKMLAGYAGTGKTTLLQYIINEWRQQGNERVNIALTAPTNKAVKVLMERVKAKANKLTIHSLLNIKPKQVGKEEIFEKDRYSSNDFNSYDLVIVDEASMVSKQLLEYIDEENIGKTKVLFCGDPAQLQPINEEKSICFTFKPEWLRQVVRHDDFIANSAKLLRETRRNVALDELLNDKVRIIDKAGVMDLFSRFRGEPNSVRMLSWTNKRVDAWNKALRRIDYEFNGVEFTGMPFQEGDIIIANEPCFDGDDIILMNSEEARVVRVHDNDNEYYSVMAKKQDVFGREDEEIRFRVLKPQFQEEINIQLEAYAHALEWREFWKTKKFYHNIRHCYGMTVHKSQGSTFNNICIDFSDIYKHPNPEERNQLLYVALTRASDTVNIIARK